MTDNKEREAFDKWWVMPDSQKAGDKWGWRGIAWGAWQGRAALAASQEKAEPIGYFVKHSGYGPWVEVARTAERAVPFYAAPVAAQASEPVAYRSAAGLLYSPEDLSYSGLDPASCQPLYAALSASAPEASFAPNGKDLPLSTFLLNVHHAYAQTDGSYAFPNSREGDMLRTAKREIEQLRVALASAPADIRRMRQQLEQEWCELQKLKASYASAPAAPMVDMVPPATSRDRWMYEQGRLAERDPRTPGSLAARVASAPAAGSVPTDDEIIEVFDATRGTSKMDYLCKVGRALLAQYGSPAIPDVLFDGHAVLQELDEKAKGRTSAENVSDVLDAIVRVLRARASAPQEGK